MSRTAAPSSRAATRRSYMKRMAPMSTPRVTWEAINSLGPAESSRATTTFCRLPPDSARTGTDASGVRIA